MSSVWGLERLPTVAPPCLKSETIARILRNEVRAITRSAPMRWVMVYEIGLRLRDLIKWVFDHARNSSCRCRPHPGCCRSAW